MLGGLGATAFAEIAGAVRRNLWIVGLYAVAALTGVAAIGYGLDALHTVLIASYGPAGASLLIAAGLVVVMLILLGAAIYLRTAKRERRAFATTALVAAPFALRLFSGRMLLRAGLVGGAALLGLMAARQFTRGDEG